MRFWGLLEDGEDGKAGGDRDGIGILAWLKPFFYVTQMRVQMLGTGEAEVASILRGRIDGVLPGQDGEIHPLF